MVTQSLQLMGYGLGGVFAALAVLALTVVLLNQVFPHKETSK